MTPAELRDARERLGYTLRQMAEALGITLTSVWRKENGQQCITRRDVLLVRALTPRP